MDDMLHVAHTFARKHTLYDYMAGEGEVEGGPSTQWGGVGGAGPSDKRKPSVCLPVAMRLFCFTSRHLFAPIHVYRPMHRPYCMRHMYTANDSRCERVVFREKEDEVSPIGAPIYNTP